jgi:hypothetical protein
MTIINSTNSWEFELCNSVNSKIIDQYGEANEAANFPELERVVVIVWAATGIIENGGFGYYFSSILPGDLNYKHTIESFNAIGSTKAEKAINKAFQLFPGGRPPYDKSERMASYHSYPEDLLSSIDIEFYDSIEELEKCLAAYIILNELHKKWIPTQIM